uniref:Alpha 1,4-glycosyltransferase domain-containing protein n=1 Tax=Lotharella globosa TaxID=91324 RepID=A0A7S4DRE6_9EUKA
MRDLVLDLERYESSRCTTSTPSRGTPHYREGTPPPQRGTPLRQPQSIPKIIHQTWKSADAVPNSVSAFMSSWMHVNPEWTHIFWSDEDNRKLVEANLPMLLPVFDMLKPVEQADISRILYLYYFGGVYADMDFESLKPMETIMDLLEKEKATGFIGSEPRAHTRLLEHKKGLLFSNAILGSVGGEPFWLALVLKIIIGLSSSVRSDPVSTTGPRILTKTYLQYYCVDTYQRNRTRALRDAQASIVGLDDDYFYPQVAMWNLKNMLRQCDPEAVRDDEERSLCRTLTKIAFNKTAGHTENSVAVHHWMCSWCRGVKAETFLPLSSIIPPHASRRPIFQSDCKSQNPTRPSLSSSSSSSTTSSTTSPTTSPSAKFRSEGEKEDPSGIRQGASSSNGETGETHEKTHEKTHETREKTHETQRTTTNSTTDGVVGVVVGSSGNASEEDLEDEEELEQQPSFAEEEEDLESRELEDGGGGCKGLGRFAFANQPIVFVPGGE